MPRRVSSEWTKSIQIYFSHRHVRSEKFANFTRHVQAAAGNHYTVSRSCFLQCQCHGLVHAVRRLCGAALYRQILRQGGIRQCSGRVGGNGNEVGCNALQQLHHRLPVLICQHPCQTHDPSAAEVILYRCTQTFHTLYIVHHRSPSSLLLQGFQRFLYCLQVPFQSRQSS